MRTKKVDVIVAGGGTAGVIAGIAAARNGAKTLIVDKQRCLGDSSQQGCWGPGLVSVIKRKLL